MSRTLSIFLDVLRFSAAIIVVMGHFTESSFSTIWPDLTNVAVAAVAVFFVLSGFVISFVTETKEVHPVDYAVARISRLYSVLVPAIVLSGIVLLIGLKLDPGYIYQWNNPSTNLGFLQARTVFRFTGQSLLSLSFLNSVRNHNVYPAMNSPIWSLSFEAAYYVLFGLAVFMRGWRRALFLAAGCLLFGTDILRLLPVWLAGVVLHRLTVRLRPSRLTMLLGLACLAVCVAAAFAWPSVDAWCHAPHSSTVELILRGKGRANEAYLFYYWGAVTSLLILAVAALEPMVSHLILPTEKLVRWCASHTFSIYLFHFPLLVLIYTVTHYNRSSRMAAALVFSSTLLFCLLLSTISESKKLWWRKLIRRCFQPLPVATRSNAPSGPQPQ